MNLFCLIQSFITIRPFSGDIIAGIIIVIILLFISAVISGSEVAFFSLNPKTISKLKSSTNKRGQTILALLDYPEKLLATILITNNFVNVGIVILSSFITNALFDFSGSPVWGFFIQVILITFILLMFGEILPKVYATQRALSLAKFMALPLKGLGKVFSPFSNVLVRSTNLMNKRLAKRRRNLSIDDLSHALDLVSDELKDDEKILKGIVKFGSIDVREIMVSRLDVKAVDIQTNFRRLLGLIVESGYSRIPVYGGDIDNMKGILYVKDLIPHLHKGDSFRWQSLIRHPYYVPETKKIDNLLHEFQTKKNHMAVVIDEYGGTSGIVTLEDVLEEIVGEINIETDSVARNYSQLDDKTYIFEGKTSLNDFLKLMDIDEDFFDSVKGDSDTLAGLILELRGEIPKKNETFDFGQFRFKIKSVDDRRIKQLYIYNMEADVK